MKKLFTMLFVAGLSTVAFAAGAEKSIEIRQTEPAKVMVAVSEAPKGALIVKITDGDDRLVLRDKITKEEAFAKRYDLSALAKGTYSVEVMDESGVLRSATLENYAIEKPAVYSRVSKLEENKYRLLVSNLKASDVTVSIFDGDKLIHSEKVENPQGLHKVYSIEKPGANISFRVATAGGFNEYLSAL